jgi:hypothetical protein
MIRTKLFLACALAAVVSLAGTSAVAQEPTNQITYFTFSAPFELPGGKVLPAGKYVFRIVDSPSNRHTVQVLSEDQTQMHATLLAIPAQRQEPANEPEVRFMEAEANAAPAIRTWWYPGRSIGHEFIYPKDHARRLAARQSAPVLTTAGDVTGDDAMRSGDLSRIGANGQESAWTENNANNTEASNTANAQPAPSATGEQTAQSGQQNAAMTGQQTTGQTGAQTATTTGEQTTAQTAGAQTTTATQPQTGTPANTMERENDARMAQTGDNAAGRTALPRTASVLPLVGLLGLGSLLGAGLLRFRR